jgi:Ca2+-binding EF-hand superfamily protein
MGREPGELRNERPAPRAAAANPGAAALLGLLNMAEAGRALRASSEAWLASVDTDGDAMISRKEAIVAGQQLVGGVFFRVDQNHDGRLAPMELRTARSILLREHPILRTLLSSPRTSSYSMRQLLGYLDTNGERGMELNEASLAVSTAVDALFAMSDTNRDGRIAVSELHVAANKLSESTARAALQAIDVDKNGAVSAGELDAAMLQATRQAFVRMDRNGDGMLSPEEATRTPEPKRPLAVNTEPPARDTATGPLDLNRNPTER